MHDRGRRREQRQSGNPRRGLCRGHDGCAESLVNGGRAGARDGDPPPGPDAGSATAHSAPDETHRAEAEALNEQGKDKLRSADVSGAIAAFQQANALVPDARYEFNVCLALEAQEQWDNAVAACRQARAMNPQAKLATKIDRRLDLLQHRQ